MAFKVELDGQWGPYEYCNPVTANDPRYEDPWTDSAVDILLFDFALCEELCGIQKYPYHSIDVRLYDYTT